VDREKKLRRTALGGDPPEENGPVSGPAANRAIFASPKWISG